MRTDHRGVPAAGSRPLESASTGELLGQFFQQTSELLKKELELAKAEVGATVRSAVTLTVGWLAVMVCGVLGIALLCAAAVLGLATWMPAWQSALVVGAAVLVIGGIVAGIVKSKRLQEPLARTRRTLKGDLRWAKERTA